MSIWLCPTGSATWVITTHRSCLRGSTAFVNRNVTHHIPVRVGKGMIYYGARPHIIITQTIVMTFRMYVQSMNRKLIPVIGTGIELLTRCFCALVLAPPIGFLDICFAEPLSWVVSGVVMVICYFYVLHRECQTQTEGAAKFSQFRVLELVFIL